MNYLFFDIECSDGHHICSFGYVLTDDKFKLLEKKDIVINPQSKFILAPHGKRAKIELAYSEEYFLSQPNFKHFYQEIKNLLQRENQKIFGHSVASDISFLNFACERYGLDKIDIVAFDTQKLHHNMYKKNI